MSMWTLIQVVFDIFSALGLFVVIMRMNRAPKDDPRLSRGLQLLQSKISVLEDLSDRTETQVNQLVAILENKSREVQAKVQLAENHVQAIRVSMDRSLEVAKIFQDKIPHQEIIERQNTIKHVRAARMAHQGMSVDDIAAQVDLGKAEIEFIASVNRDRLMFSEEQLPDWAKESAVDESQQPQTFQSVQETDEAPTLQASINLAEGQRLVENLSRLQFEMQSLDMQLARDPAIRDMASAFEVPRVETASLQKLGNEFRKAVEEQAVEDAKPAFVPLEQLSNFIPQVLSQVAQVSHQLSQHVSQATFIEPSYPPPPPEAMVTAATEARDPALARAQAQQRLQERLNATATRKPDISKELEIARAAAQSANQTIAAAPAPTAAKAQSPVINSRSKDGEVPVIKKVMFPRIQDGEV